MARYLVGCIAILILLFSSIGSALWVESAFNPKKTAQKSDIVVHGIVANTKGVRGTATISVIEAFKGEADHNLTVRIRGGEGADVSTAAEFSEGEEVVVMLQRKNGVLQLTHGQPGKYRVTNDTVVIREPENKRITVAEMKELIENAVSQKSSQRDQNSFTESDKNPNVLTKLWNFLVEFFEE